MTQHLPDTLVPSTALFGSFSCMLLYAATNLNFCLLFLLVLLATLDSTSYEAFITFRRTMTDHAFQARIDELATQLADLKTGIQPSVTQTAALVTSVTALRSELAAVSAVVATGNIARNTHALLDQPASEIAANFFLPATPPVTTDVSVQWLRVRSALAVLRAFVNSESLRKMFNL